MPGGGFAYTPLLSGSSTSTATVVTGTVLAIPQYLYNATASIRTEGQYGPPQADLYGNEKVAEAYSPNYEDNTNSVATTAVRFLANGAYSPGLLVADFGATITKNAKAAAGIVTNVIAENNNAQPRYLQLHNTATTPTLGAAPAISVKLVAGETKVIGPEALSVNGFKFTTGIAYAWSTVAGTYQSGSVADHTTQVFGV